MKSLKALIWSCYISVPPPSHAFLLLLIVRVILPLVCSSSPLRVISPPPLPFLFPVNTYGCHPSPFPHSPVAFMLIYPLPHSICHASSSAVGYLALFSPLPQGAVMLFLYQLLTELLLLSATDGDADLTAWYSNNVMKFNIQYTVQWSSWKVMHNFNK